jgi:hypothetical protein
MATKVNIKELEDRVKNCEKTIDYLHMVLVRCFKQMDANSNAVDMFWKMIIMREEANVQKDVI